MRSFIIFHDCGHGSFFKSRRANAFWGWVTGTLSFTPYGRWRHEHAIHHAGSGHLEKRGVGDIWTLTVKEYLESSRLQRISYQLVRNPFFLFVVGPLYLLFIRERLPRTNAKPGENASVWILNAILIAQSAALIALFGFWPWFAIQVGAVFVSGVTGIWLFYVQHQYEDAYWEGRRCVGLRSCCNGRKLFLQASKSPSMVHRQHRFPPRSSSQPTRSELQPGRVPSLSPNVRGHQTDDIFRQSENADLPTLGREAAEAD